MSAAIGTLQESVPPPWHSLLAAHCGWLRTVIYSRVRDRHAVDEVLQETALAASRQATPNDAAGICKWLYRVAIRQSLLYRRRESRQLRKIEGVAASGLPRLVAAPEQLVIASEQQALVRAALEQLNRGDCDVLLLKYVEHWSCAAIADRLGISESAVKSRLLRARHKLRGELMRLNSNWVLR